MKKKITVLAADLSDNNLLRAYLLARAISDHYEVRIVGPKFRSGIWPPLACQDEIDISAVRLNATPLAYFKIQKLYRLLEGDLLIVCKPLLLTLGLGLLWKKIKKRPLILDIDDWEKGFIAYKYASRTLIGKARGWVYSLAFPLNRDSRLNVEISERLIPCADSIIVSNSFLQSRYGGILVYHCRLSREDVPDHVLGKATGPSCRMLNGKKVVMFFGTPRKHKGLEVLIEAIKDIGDDKVVLMVVGMDLNDVYCREVLVRGKKALGDAFITRGFQPVERIGAILTMADVVVIPQLAVEAGWGQVPAKVFDAMAYAKPIVATACGDMSEIIRGCGVLVEPGNKESLAAALKCLLEDEMEAEKMGALARERWRGTYCREVIVDVLHELIERTISGAGSTYREDYFYSSFA